MEATPPCPLTADLLDHLRDEESLLREALASLTDLFAALRRGDLNAVNATRPRQESLAAALSHRHPTRAAAAARLAEAVGLPPADLTLSILAAHLPSDAASGLLAARDRLADLAAQLKEYQRRNAILIRHLRSYFRGVMSALAGADAPVRYGPSGSSLTPKTGTMIQTRG
ncbi:MAG: FlgN protein [Gemmataceae bacterium]|nr:FlgN protein [Gemmataceae bacterium]